jgi:VWFA-related protein
VEQEPIRISTEEVQLSVTALDSHGRRDAALVRDDILILEDGVPQEIRSVRRLPANVILLLDTGGEINSAKRVAVTRDVAVSLVSSLANEDQISVMQFNNHVEVLTDWTRGPKTVVPVLESKLLPGKRTRFLDAVAVATERFKNSARLNRHLVLITDGVQSDGDRVDREALLRQLMAANVTVHVISYTAVSRQATQQDLRRTRKRDKSIVPDDAVDSLPGDKRDNILKQAHEPGGVIVDLDQDRRRQLKRYQRALQLSQIQLEAMARETGGDIWLPESVDAMVADAVHTADLIDAAYVVTYKPKRPLTEARAGEARRIEIASRRVGLQLTTRRRYIVPGDLLSGEIRPRRTAN